MHGGGFGEVVGWVEGVDHVAEDPEGVGFVCGDGSVAGLGV